MVTVQLTTEPDGQICLASPYHKDFVDGLKLAIPYRNRAWDSVRKRWIVHPDAQVALADFLTSVGARVLDLRTQPSGQALPPVQGASHETAPPMPDELRQAFDDLHLAYTAPLCVAEAAYKALSKFYHPDHGGEVEEFYRVAGAIQVIRTYLDPQPQKETDDGLPF